MRFRLGEKRENRIRSFKSLLPSVIHDFNLDEDYVLGQIQVIWPDVVGEIIATHSVPKKIIKSTLYVSVDHPVYANEIAMIQNSIIASLQEKHKLVMIRYMRTDIERIEGNSTQGKGFSKR
ncbi:MAG: DciA family protein [Spirochaetota bacterium]